MARCLQRVVQVGLNPSCKNVASQVVLKDGEGELFNAAERLAWSGACPRLQLHRSSGANSVPPDSICKCGKYQACCFSSPVAVAQEWLPVAVVAGGPSRRCA